LARDAGLLRLLDKWAPWLAGAVLIAGVCAYVATRLVSGGTAATSRPVPLGADQRRVAVEFVQTAVARRQLAKAWTLVAPELKHGMTLAEWKTGSIPVVPYKVAGTQLRLAPVDSFTDHADVDVTFLRAGAGDTFRLGLRNVGGRWLVSSWVPASAVTPNG
jgi:hypothetical protein